MFIRIESLVAALLLLFATLLSFRPIHQARKGIQFSPLQAQSFYDIVEKDANGNEVSFSKFKGKVVYGVNVATKCGYTASGYALLSKISAMKDIDVEVAIFPCNQFGRQEVSP